MGKGPGIGGFGGEDGGRVGELAAGTDGGGFAAFLRVGEVAWFGGVFFVGVVEMVAGVA